MITLKEKKQTMYKVLLLVSQTPLLLTGCQGADFGSLICCPTLAQGAGLSISCGAAIICIIWQQSPKVHLPAEDSQRHAFSPPPTFLALGLVGKVAWDLTLPALWLLGSLQHFGYRCCQSPLPLQGPRGTQVLEGGVEKLHKLSLIKCTSCSFVQGKRGTGRRFK